MPKRIQRKRTKGWRMPEDAVYVGRPSRWGNPYFVSDVAARYPSITVEQAAQFAVNEYRDWVARAAPYADEDLDALRGRDLACWCPPDMPCHADVLLDIANRPL